MKRILSGLTLGLLVFATGCATHAHAGDGAAPASEAATSEFSRPFGFSQGEFEDTDGDGLPDSRKPSSKGRVARLDDVTNNPAAPGTIGTGTESGVTDAKEPPAPDAIDRKMIYSASYSLMVPVVDDTIKKLTARVTALGGYLSSQQDSTLTVRVPAAKFESFIAEIPELGRVVARSMNANDVTDQHTDLVIRLENSEASRKRLLALLEKATKVEDIIKIEEALRRITGEIERMKGQLKLMNDRIAYSTVSITLQANAPPAKQQKQRQQSRFPWINRIGIEQDLRRF